MKVRELMTQKIESITSDSDLCQAAQMMREMDIGALPVSEGGKLVGIVTDRDIVVRGVCEDYRPSETPVSQVMTGGELELLSADSELSDAAATMAAKQVRRLLVTDENAEIVGILSIGDLATHCEDVGLAGKTLEKVSQPER